MGGPSCDGSVGNITVLEGSKSGSVHVDAVKKESVDPVSCGYKSCGRSVAQAKLASVGGPSCVGPVLGNITVSEGSKSGSVHVDASKKESLDSVSCSHDSYGCSIAQEAKLASMLHALESHLCVHAISRSEFYHDICAISPDLLLGPTAPFSAHTAGGSMVITTH
jgi:hypothetical protein